MKYRRLKSIDGSGTIMRYYKIEDGTEALANTFYGVNSNSKVERIEGTVGNGVTLIGFSHGGDRLAKGLVFLDINPSIVYMGILGDGEDRPKIGDVVNGYQRVIDTHYDGDEGVDGKNDDEFGVETLDNPYYLFTIIQPDGTAYASEIDDSDSGEEPGPVPEPTLNYGVISVITENGTGVLKYTPKGGSAATATLTYGGATFKTAYVAKAGDTLSTVYDAIAMYDNTGTNLVVDLKGLAITGETTIAVAVPVQRVDADTTPNAGHGRDPGSGSGAGVGGNVETIVDDPPFTNP